MRQRLSLMLVISCIVTFICGLAVGLISLSGRSDGHDNNSARADQASSSDDADGGSSGENDGRTDSSSTVAQSSKTTGQTGHRSPQDPVLAARIGFLPVPQVVNSHKPARN